MTIVADEEVLTAAELDLAVDSLDDAAAVGTDVDAALAAVAGDKPFLIIEKGAPTDEEIAALVCVLSAAAGSAAPTGPQGPNDFWGRPTMMHRGTSPFSPYAFPQLSHLR
ncbi:acyl-CoA carboxylase subunit epsilon [Nocardia cyriacigeorgica]|uniref:acyl-CoA carboxylase subunit epsilon n=1 Tax=Nocardia cyriacigeorgica TaxID=135487 RepID=UPI0018932EC1|nr:acyl-CoA carboxylase subunit epsilon [Nocardia cyriacigeorgica]MBF6438820.1 acyl-CoA carboxylase subunit epsilon [Nocardia cyriacigeorgica]MBF6457275.1 acyl-CoA carboxylase subunit epsilon [Nocardia cyriacigeorgica]MBF6482358.1 acyl-CoA carboxylase subunit epsilon [Nocardia cyriacigeorgica]MBF6554458.1 acyl-CoA carboxylase subunit epsilon [Nocardia cyriacigeorgica]